MILQQHFLFKNTVGEDADSAVFVDEDWLPPSGGSRISLSRSSSQCSVCSCMACSQQATEWKRRPSRLLEGYDVEDFYRFDAVLGTLFSEFMADSNLCILKITEDMLHFLLNLC